MDKNTYETYEFLPSNENESENDQFFVVQDDGTFLLNRQIQYVAQVQDVKQALEDVQPCTMYGVSSQPFFVDIDNSSELISVSDQFILPDGDNSLYTNSYLLQPGSSTTTEQMEDVVEQYKQPNTQDVDIDIATHNSKQGSNFTEITLSDEQYQTLEQKGWILLESNDKIFVLNALGLHDITANDKLIQKLRNEIQNSTNITGNDGGTLKIESVSSQFSNFVSEPMSIQQETVEFVMNEQNDNIKCVQFVVDDNKEAARQLDRITSGNEINSDKFESPHELLEPETPVQPKQETFYDKDTCSIKIKTKFNFKDIPDKLILGKSVKGKRLTAKVVKLQSKKNNVSKNKSAEDVVLKQIAGNEHYYMTGLHEVDFVNLIQVTLRTGTSFNEEDIASTDTVISQLLKVPNLKQSFVGHNLIVTKATNKGESGANYNRSKITLITGRVKEKDGTYGFDHIPNLLQTIKLNAEEQNVSQSDEVFSCLEEKEAKENFTIYHVHITETKCVDNVVRVSVTLNKRHSQNVNQNETNVGSAQSPPPMLRAISSPPFMFVEQEVESSQTNWHEPGPSRLSIAPAQSPPQARPTTAASHITLVEARVEELPVNLVFDLKRRYPTTVFGCSSCAMLFKSEEALKEHQENKCMDTDDMMQIEEPSDQSNNDDDVIIMKTGKETTFSCAQCHVKFTKLSNIHRHMKTHQGTRQILQTNRVIEADTQPKMELSKIYKCKMCPSTYFHSASLSKHIVSRHIKVKSNKNVV